MSWKKREKGKSAVSPGLLEILVDQGVEKWLVWDTYVAATNMPDPYQQRLGLTLIRTCLRSMGRLSQAYVALSGLIGGSVDVQKAIDGMITPLGKMPYATDVFAEAELMLLGTDTKLDKDAVLNVEEIYELIREYNQTEVAMARFAYQSLPEAIGRGVSQLTPKRIKALDSLLKD